MNEIPTRYNPKEAEDKWYKLWEENNLFTASPNLDKKPFCIVIPPPNVTGILHMGHALNNTIQDILIRYHRMKGDAALWMPGTDHAGIATQNVVEKSIAKEGLKRQDLGREAFIERVWKWKEQYGSTIIRQLKKLGASCDWNRLRFTMDFEYSKAVTEVFVRLYEKGLIYQGSYIINWCPRCQTALSDEEAPHHELQGNLYYLKYPFKDNPEDFIVVATTRPETMLGDTAVAVNPKDKRYKKIIGKVLILPLVNREIKIIADDMVNMEFGTGAVKVTPAHDPNDYALGKKHGLDFISVMYPDARMNENAGEYKDMDRFEAREVIIEDLKEKELIDKITPHLLSAGHCYRCHTIIEPYLSKQWFVKMKPLALPAIKAVKQGKIKFHPKRWEKVYLNWMENIQDWCISRQIWWGHRLPVYYCKNCKEQDGKSIVYGQQTTVERKSVDYGLSTVDYKGILVSRTKIEECPVCGSSNIYQDEDVLDTWFSSWLWPFATFYWPAETQSPDVRPQVEENLKYFYPTSVLVTAPEIIFFWVARMIMAGFEFMNELPFRDVYIHGTVRDIEGKKMSKSLGNVIDPLEIINEYGTDALRFSIISITAQGQDVFLSKERFEQGRNFANKIWNASRFILMNLEPELIKVDLCVFFDGMGKYKTLSQPLKLHKEYPESRLRRDEVSCKQDLDVVNRWILSKFYSALEEVNKSLASFHFNEAVNMLYVFFWHDFCDWYLEIIKQDIKNARNQVVMYKILEKFLRALHPFMPFITEEIWQRLPHDGKFIMSAAWPHVQAKIIDHKLEKSAQSMFDVIKEIRNLRTQIEIKPDQKVKVSVYTHSKAKQHLLGENSKLIINLARLEALDVLENNERPQAVISAVVLDVDVYLHFSGLLDVKKEQVKIKGKIEELNKFKSAKETRLNNPDFIKKAPEEVVEKEKKGIDELKNSLKRLEKMLSELL